MADRFKVGDVVMLKSDGPEMTIADTEGYGGDDKIKCQWFGGRKLEEGWFPIASIVHVEGEK